MLEVVLFEVVMAVGTGVVVVCPQDWNPGGRKPTGRCKANLLTARCVSTDEEWVDVCFVVVETFLVALF